MTNAESLRLQLGIADAPLVRAGLGEVCTFFWNNLGENPGNWIAYLRGIDFHRPVRSERLARGTRLIRYETTGSRTFKPFSYFTRPGTSPQTLGASFSETEFKEFEVIHDVQALVSTASGVKFGPRDGISRPGGGVQYIIAFKDAPALLRVGERH